MALLNIGTVCIRRQYKPAAFTNFISLFNILD